ncbi:PQQ-binding-like beta-propeller repeat protein [Rhodococcus qingshengii]|uniref:outer membrane protein assembly factor BamB family protein n=1 Tax=Rhodococcus qingshengii TaxID=334542 RepID=UPI0035A598A3
MTLPPPPPPPPPSPPQALVAGHPPPSRSRGRGWIVAVAALTAVAALAAGAVTVVTILRSGDTDGPVAGQLVNTYPTQPTPGWSLDVDEVLPGGRFLWPDSLGASYGTARFIDVGQTLITTVGPQQGQQSQLVAVDAESGSIRWQTPVAGTVSCATTAIDAALPCVVRNPGGTARVVSFSLDSGAIRSSVDTDTATLVEVSDGAVFTVGGSQSGLVISRGTPTDLDAAWTTTTPPETDCVGSGDSHSFEIVDGIVYYSSIGSTALNAVDGALLSNPNLGGYEALPGQGFAGVLCAMPFASDGYSSIVSDRDGAERFRVDEDAPASPWLVSASKSRPYIGSHGAYDMNDGTELWSVIGGDHFSLRRIVGDIVLGNDSDTLSAYRIDTGEQLWSTKIGDYFSYSVSDGERILVHPNDGRVLAVELDDGSVSWSLDSHTNHWSWSKAHDGLASISNDRFLYYPPTGGPSGAPGRLPAVPEFDGGNEYVTKCGRTPTLTPVEYRTQAEGLVVLMEMKASCPGGDIVSTDALRVSITDTGQSVASAVFDFSDAPIYLPRTDGTNTTNSIQREFLYDLGSFWRLPNTLGESSSLTNSRASGAQLVECEDDGTSDTSLTSGPASRSDTNTPIRPTRSAQPTTGDVESASLDALRAQADADRPFVIGDLANRWVAQISSKRVGLDAADINGAQVHWTAAQILRQHLELRLMYPEVRLLWSDEWRTFDLRGWWITVAGLTFADADAANGWCDSKRIANDQCFAKIVSNDRDSSGTTKYRR